MSPLNEWMTSKIFQWGKKDAKQEKRMKRPRKRGRGKRDKVADRERK